MPLSLKRILASVVTTCLVGSGDGRDRSADRESLLKGVAACHDLGMPVELSDPSARQSSGRRWTVGWVLGVVLALVFGGFLVRTVMLRDRRSPLASRPLLIRTLDHPLILLGGEPQNRFDPPRAGQHAGIPAAAVFHAWLRLTRHSYDRAVPSSKPIPVTLARWSRQRRAPVGSPGRLVWLFQLTSVPCLEAGFLPPGQPTPPPDRDGCDEYRMFDARSGAAVGEGLMGVRCCVRRERAWQGGGACKLMRRDVGLMGARRALQADRCQPRRNRTCRCHGPREGTAGEDEYARP